MKLCIGSFFTLLKLCVAKNVLQKELVSVLIKGIDERFIESDDDSSISAITRGARGLSRNAIEGARRVDVIKLAEYFEVEVICRLNLIYSRVIVLALVDMLRKDTDISSNTVIDMYTGRTKGEVVACNSFTSYEACQEIC